MSFWPKAGLTFTCNRINGPSGDSILKNFWLAVDLDATFAFELVEHFGLTLTPYADIPLMTKTAALDGDFNNSASIWNFGGALGLVGWF